MNRNNATLTLALLTVLIPSSVTLLGSVPAPQKPTRPPETELEDFAWMTGTWQKKDEKQLLEETWGKPIGNTMVGSFRWLREGKGWVYEFLLIEKTEKGVTFYLRHFGPGAIAWEPVDKPLDFPLKSVKKNEALFEHPTRKKMKRLVYQRTEDGGLTVRVEGEKPDGQPSATVFRFEQASSKTESAQKK